MYILTKTYTDYNDVERTEDFYFNLSKAELMEMNLSAEGGLQKKLTAIVQAKNVPELANIFKKIVLQAYGIKSEDGKSFEKSDELRHKFENSAAYSEIYMDLVTDDVFAAKFINSIIPKDLVAETAKEANK